MNLYAFTPDTGTHEMPKYRRGVPFADQLTEPIGFPWAAPTPTVTRVERPRWSLLGRVLAAILAVDLAGIAYVVVTSR